MSVKMQFLKYSLYVLFYFVVCVILIHLRRNFNTVEMRRNEIYHRNKTRSWNVDRVIRNPVEAEISILQTDEMKGEAIDPQETANLLRQVSNICKKYKLKTPLTRRHFLYSAKNKSIYCWIRKVASTSFTKLFSDMSNRQTNHNFYREVDFLAPDSLQDLQHFVNDSNIFKLLVVRHPFHRLVSSYRDRIEDNSKHTAQAWLYSRQIFYLSRPELFHSNSSAGNVLQRIFSPDRRLKVVPTFREFLEWLLKQSPTHDDVHWAQYYKHCSACDINYNFILKLDVYTLGQINYVFNKLKLDKNKTYFPMLERTHNGVTNFHVTCQYFANLTTDLVLQLYQRYKMDFDMYNYKLDRYLQCAKKKN